MLQRTIVIGLGVVFACSGSRPASLPEGAFSSLPKADWPCARRYLHKTGRQEMIEGETHRIRYTELSSCLIPTELVSEGIVGCPAQIGRYIARYDGDRMLAFDAYTAQWTAAFVHEVGHSITRHGDDLECRRADGTLHARLQRDDRDRPIHEIVFSRTGEPAMTVDLSWQGARLDAVEIASDSDVDRYEHLYDCSKL